MAIAVSDLSVPVMDHQLASLVPADFSCPFNRFLFSFKVS